jgi:hypothetical protein
MSNRRENFDDDWGRGGSYEYDTSRSQLPKGVHPPSKALNSSRGVIVSTKMKKKKNLIDRYGKINKS